MKRRQFLTYAALTGSGSLWSLSNTKSLNFINKVYFSANEGEADELQTDVVIIGGGFGGCAAALAACRNGLNVVMTEETDWIGGQVSQQGVPPDEHPWIETHGASASYRTFRNKVREYYRRNYPLTDEARACEFLNPGDGLVSRLCHEPIVSEAVLTEMLLPYLSTGKLKLLLRYKARYAEMKGDSIRAVEVYCKETGHSMALSAPYFVDATECGDLLPLTQTEYVTGAEAKSETNELHAAAEAMPMNNQAFTVCFAMDYVPGANLTIDKPADYAFWHDYIPSLKPAWSGRLIDLSYPDPITLKTRQTGFHPEGKELRVFNLWNYRRIISRKNFTPGLYSGDITIVNWPQNDYLLGNLLDVPEVEFEKHIAQAKQLNLSLFYWLQTEAPRPDGGMGWPGLRLRGDVLGTDDGMAKYPYIREARRIKALFTVTEEHVGKENRKLATGETRAAEFYDSIGIGYYRIDLHPSFGGDNYIDIDSLPFQIPLGALIPQRVDNLLPACKNIGTTHITNGCYRLHPVEWSVGEAVGMLLAYAKEKKVLPRTVRENRTLLSDFQQRIQAQGAEIGWKNSSV
ncbi:FAD-dependent oxidoreductase [Tannerella forsythia]|uniref:FAD-dependent oxidoreductase n=1 Tax=Tannerella forsythia TaxID=28112 RepID=A0A2A6E955_TANFO|nr:FAD-dependent oxidoreductase [Tannerella forsythia]PDP44164.1 FAD-dependent oxidoreductase [Tannerella forsythia]PDP72187.1 FAD-dependent oxidoreductase [Tannerella forsythia]